MSLVLIIDDDAATLELVRGRIAGEVESSDEVRAGLKIAARRFPAAILLNADLPSGYAACRKLKKHEKYSAIPIVLMSASATPEQFADHAKLPTAADAYIHKPLDADQLVAVLSPWAQAAQPEAVAVELPPELPDDVEESPPPPPEVDLDSPAGAVDADMPHAEFDLDSFGAMMDRADESPEPSAEPEPELSPSVNAELEVLVRQLERENKELKGRAAAKTREEMELKQEVTKLADRVHNLKIAHERMDEAFEIERTRYRTRIRELEDRAKELGKVQQEMSSMRNHRADMLESLEMIYESLQVPLEIVARHRELAEGAPLEDLPPEPLALTAEPLEERAPIALGGPPELPEEDE